MGIPVVPFGKFHGGVHPKEYKHLTEAKAIEAMPIPPRLYVPLHQSLGKPAEPCVKVGDKVRKGDRIAKPVGFVSAAVHAPTSGTVVAIQEYTVGHPSGLTMPCVVIDSDGEEYWNPELKGLDDPLNADPSAIREMIKQAGIVGLGGATFPSFIKMSPPQDKVVETLIINGAECEPYLTCDARVMEERAADIVGGIEIMLHALQTRLCVIGVENNKMKAAMALKAVVGERADIKVAVLPVMYPQGSEKQLIEVLTNRQVPSGGLPIDVGVIVHNVATAVAIRDAVVHGKPLISRVVTVSGLGIYRPANVEVLIGTPVQSLVNHCGGLRKFGLKKVVMGGPMMGVAMSNLEAPVVKGTSGILALLDEEVHGGREQPCIRCGRCLQACPISLAPTDMAFFSRHDKLDELKEINLFDCIECGSCAYVCPANIPLVHYFRYGKMAILANDREKRQKEMDKSRAQAKLERLAREQAEKERKKAEMKAQMAAKKPAAAPAAKAEASAEAPPAAAPAEAAAPVDEDGARKAAAAARAAKAAAAARAARAAKSAAPAESATASVPEAVAPAAEAPIAPESAAPVDEEAAKKAAAAARAAKAAAAARAARAAKKAAAEDAS